MEELYINDLLIELKDGSVSRTLQINDLAEVKDRQSNYSKSIKIPMTPNNIKALGFLGVIGNTSRFPYEKLSIKYILNGIELVSSGKGVIKYVSSSLYLVIYDGNISMTELLGAKTISSLDFSAYNHQLSQGNWLSSFTNTSGYIYGLGQFYEAASTSLIQIDLQSPSFYYHTLIDMIFTQNGYSIAGDIFTDSNFTNRLLSVNNGHDRVITDNTSLAFNRSNSLDPSVSESFGVETIKSYIIDSLPVTNPSVYDINISGSVDLFKGQDGSISIYADNIEILNFNFFASSFDKDVSVFLDSGDDIEVFVNVTSEDGGGGTHFIDFQTSYTTNIVDNNRTIDIDFSVLFGEITQIDLVKDFMQRYGLMFKTDVYNKVFEFKQMSALLEDYSNAEDWSNKHKLHDNRLFIKEDYRSNYSIKNYMRYQYDSSDTNVTPTFGDGSFLIDSVNLSSSRTLFTSVLKASEISSNPSLYKLNHWKDDNGVLKPLDDGIRIFKRTLVEGTIIYNYSNNVSGSNSFSGISPRLDFNTLCYDEEIDRGYLQFKSMLDSYNKKTVLIDLSVLDIYNIDFFKLKYISQLGGYYYLNKVSNFRPNKLTTVELIRVGDKVVNRLKLTGSSSGSSTVSGLVTVLGQSEISGVSNGSSTVSGFVTVTNSDLSSFNTSPSGSPTSSGGCALFSLDTRYHDGAFADPITGDFIYEDVLGVTPFNGGSQWYKLNFTGTIKINSSGEMIDKQNC